MSLKFEWDRSKAKANFAKHRISFEFAKGVFNDPFATEFPDDRREYDEQRYVILGLVNEIVLYVAYAERNEAIRIISARRATKHEKEAYFG
jgi:uncharacterized protein